MPPNAPLILRRLVAEDAAAYAAHLLRLPVEDLRLRFYGAVEEAWVRGHARAALDKPHAGLAQGACEGGLLRAVALCPTVQGGSAELTISVEAAWRRHGLARALVARLLHEAARQGCDRAVLPLEPAAPGLRAFALACGARPGAGSGDGFAEFAVP